jgi:hypothetical protein
MGLKLDKNNVVCFSNVLTGICVHLFPEKWHKTKIAVTKWKKEQQDYDISKRQIRVPARTEDSPFVLKEHETAGNIELKIWES